MLSFRLFLLVLLVSSFIRQFFSHLNRDVFEDSMVEAKAKAKAKAKARGLRGQGQGQGQGSSRPRPRPRPQIFVLEVSLRSRPVFEEPDPWAF